MNTEQRHLLEHVWFQRTYLVCVSSGVFRAILLWIVIYLSMNSWMYRLQTGGSSPTLQVGFTVQTHTSLPWHGRFFHVTASGFQCLTCCKNNQGVCDLEHSAYCRERHAAAGASTKIPVRAAELPLSAMSVEFWGQPGIVPLGPKGRAFYSNGESSKTGWGKQIEMTSAKSGKEGEETLQGLFPSRENERSPAGNGVNWYRWKEE